MSDKAPRRSPRPRKSKAVEQLSPEQRLRAQIQGAYLDRQLQWQWQLKGTSPDWDLLLGIHLQMSELERMFAGLEQMS
jgi:hypothetical protein